MHGRGRGAGSGEAPRGVWYKRGVSNDFSRWAPPEADSTPAHEAEPTTQRTAEQSQGSAAGGSGVASSLKPVLGSLVTGATRTTATPRSSASRGEASSPASAPRKGSRPPRRTRDPQRLTRNALYERLLDKKVIIGAVLAVVALVLALPRLMALAPSFSSVTKRPSPFRGIRVRPPTRTFFRRTGPLA